MPADQVIGLMDRRTWIAGFAGGLVAFCALAEAQTARIPRIGFLGNSTAELEANLIGPWRQGLRELGYVEGQNVVVEYRWAEGHYERFPALIKELLAGRGDLQFSDEREAELKGLVGMQRMYLVAWS